MKYCIFIWMLVVKLSAQAQMTSGLTNIRDTSYTIQNELKKNLKNYPEITVVNVSPSTRVKEEFNIAYGSTGKRDLLLDVFYPSELTSKKRVAILFIHGGGWRSGDRNMHHSLARRLAQFGYLCVTPEYTLSTEALFPNAVLDLKAAVRWLRKNALKYNIDSNKIVVAGHSAGGELASFVASTEYNSTYEGACGNNGYSSKVNAVINIDGIVSFIHPESGEGDDSKKISAATYWLGYSKSQYSKLWIEASPLKHVEFSPCPTLFINSSVSRMHAGRDDYIKILKQHHVYSKVKTFEGAPHTFCFFNPWFEPMVETMDSFIKKVFK